MSSPIPVLFMHHVSMLGGAERYAVSVIEHLDQKYQPHFVLQERGPLSESLESKGVKVSFTKMRGWRKIKYWLTNRLTVLKLVKYVRENGIKLICNNAFRLSGYATATARAAGVPCVSVLHDYIPIPKLKRYGLFESDEIVAVSNYLADSIQEAYPKKVRVIYNGVDSTFLDHTAEVGRLREEFGVPKDRGLLAGTVINLIPKKNPKLFLKAMGKIGEEFPNARFVVVGDELDKNLMTMDELKFEAARYNINNKIVFTGFRDDVADIIAAMDAFVLPSDEEPFGRVLIEAMALRKPVVTTRSGGPQEIVDETCGYLADVGDNIMLADGVRRIFIDEKEARQKGEAGRKKVEEKFLINKTVTQFNRLFDEMLAQ